MRRVVLEETHLDDLITMEDREGKEEGKRGRKRKNIWKSKRKWGRRSGG